MTKKIFLKGINANGEYFIVDNEDFDLLNEFDWHNNHGYARRNTTVEGKLKCIYAHREILKCPKNMVVDHINGDKLDNRRSNLRICTAKENLYNSKASGESKYKGVCKQKHTGNWESKITKNKKTYNLGAFKKEEDAALAYNRKAKKLFGEYAFLNDVKKDGRELKTVLESSKTSHYTGVYKENRTGHFISFYSIGGSSKRLGSFTDEFEAALHYNREVIKKFGNVKKLNDIFDDGRVLESKVKRKRKSKYKNVLFERRTNKYFVEFQENKKRIRVGTFSDEDEAARAYNEFITKNKINKPLIVIERDLL